MADALMFLPVFNQINEIPRVISEIRDEGPGDVDFLLFDNGSTDGSSEVIAGSGLPFLAVERNQGIGHSYALALDWASERGTIDSLARWPGTAKCWQVRFPD